MENSGIYVDNLNLLSFFTLLKIIKKSKKNKKKGSIFIYYFEANSPLSSFFIYVINFFHISISKLNFKLKDIVDSNGELVRIRLNRKDLFYIQNKILKSNSYKNLKHETWNQDRILDYINKGLVKGGIYDKLSLSRTLFMIEVLNYNNKLSNISDSALIFENRPWIEILLEESNKYKINLYIYPQNFNFKKFILKKLIIKFPELYGLAKNLKYQKNINESNKIYKLLVQGRGDFSLINDGYHSDFFWLMNSSFSKNNLAYMISSQEERSHLTPLGVYCISESTKLSEIKRENYIKPIVSKNNSNKIEYNFIRDTLSEYSTKRDFWRSIFATHNIKIFFTWYKYENEHIEIADAISSLGGISAVWQMAFDGYPTIESSIFADVSFIQSNFSHQIDCQNGSKTKYEIITGYPKDYAASKLKDEAIELRKKMQSNGAKKIIFVIDENSIDDSRWHTGHELQRENYYYILDEVIKNPWLGVVFKPKHARNLRERLGEVSVLLSKAESTGRCFIYEKSNRHSTSAPPLLAGLTADICIHSHLSGGTAALECVLEGLPTLLIDREGCPNSKLYELPVGKVIFKNWPDTIKAIMNHFSTPNGIPGFGDWSSIIDQLDPFRDGKAAYRMGTYLQWLMEGFESGKDKELNLKDATDKYKKTWGADKVYINF